MVHGIAGNKGGWLSFLKTKYTDQAQTVLVMIRFWIVALWLLVCVALMLYPGRMALGMTNVELQLITHPDNSRYHEIPRRTVRAIYSLRTQSWPNGTHLTVFVLPDRELLHEAFCQRILGVLPYQLRRGWDRLVFSGKSAGPIRVRTLREMKRKVAATPGAIGYVTPAYVDDSVAVIEVR